LLSALQKISISYSDNARHFRHKQSNVIGFINT